MAPAPAGQTPVHDDHELIESLWLRPADALERHRSGQMDLILPDHFRTLQATLARFERGADLLAAAIRAERRPPVESRRRAARPGQPHRVARGSRVPGDGAPVSAGNPPAPVH